MRNFIVILAFALLTLQVACVFSKVYKSGVTLSATDLNSFNQDELAMHNAKRFKHKNTGNLTLDAGLTTMAQAYAEQLQSTHTFLHSSGVSNVLGSYGENLYYAWAFPSLTIFGGKAS